MNEEIFALDIGTRKVMGIVARKTDERLEIIDAEVVEHSKRCMLDGQIHNIEDVAKVVRKVKETLEARLHKKLTHVGVAVAGRNLRTFTGKATQEFESEQDITGEMVKSLELAAVDKITADPENNISGFYCAGYSPVYYELAGNKLADITGHRAKSISCELIVTFLPRVVLDSMFAVLKKAGLEATNITLEPIAALNAIIPPEIRNLHIILVDVGAGTSDLALTKDGFINAYGMGEDAGDEITECISGMLLVDFTTAEKIKRSLNGHSDIEYEDIWGRIHSLAVAGLIEQLSPAIKKLAESIAKTALSLNGGITPQAVVAVGGGSLTYGLINQLAACFGLSLDKVGLRLPSAIKTMYDATGKLNGPEAVTPIGIALMAAQASGLQFIEIEVNKKRFRLLDFQQKKDILGALTLAQAFTNKKLYPRPGMAITCQVNGELTIIKGTLGKPAVIQRNGKSVNSLSEKIENGDILEFQEAENGIDASCNIKGLLTVAPTRLTFNHDVTEVMPPVAMNEKEVDLETPVEDRANIRILDLKIRGLLKSQGIPLESLSERQILVNINGQPKVLTQRNFTLLLNGQSAGLDTTLSHNDTVEFSLATPTSYRIKDCIALPEACEIMRVNVAGKDVEMRIEPIQIFMNGHQVKPEEFLIDGAQIKVYYLKERKVLLSEIFNYIDFDPRKAMGKRMKILVNDMPAGFTTALTEGSRVNILFEERINPEGA